MATHAPTAATSRSNATASTPADITPRPSAHASRISPRPSSWFQDSPERRAHAGRPAVVHRRCTPGSAPQVTQHLAAIPMPPARRRRRRRTSHASPPAPLHWLMASRARPHPVPGVMRSPRRGYTSVVTGDPAELAGLLRTHQTAPPSFPPGPAGVAVGAGAGSAAPPCVGVSSTKVTTRRGPSARRSAGASRRPAVLEQFALDRVGALSASSRTSSRGSRGSFVDGSPYLRGGTAADSPSRDATVEPPQLTCLRGKSSRSVHPRVPCASYARRLRFDATIGRSDVGRLPVLDCRARDHKLSASSGEGERGHRPRGRPDGWA